ncbi:MAG: nucleotidyltransferase family protein [Parasporobacterium sp.]|nr:nucleotidyltransferase family protein [Parasporobacterium sp.]
MNPKTIALLRMALSGQREELVFDVGEWDQVFADLSEQTVQAIPSNVVSTLNLTQQEQDAYVQYCISNLTDFYMALELQSEVQALFREQGIPSVSLKGVSAAMLYPQPELRCTGDIDLLVLPEDYDRACSILTEKGFIEEPTELNGRHTGYRKPGYPLIELHRYYSSSDNKEQNRILDDMLYEGIRNARTLELEGYEISILPPLENGMVLLGHINQHLSSGLGLRQIFDWGMYVQKHLPDEMWTEQFATVAESVGMKKLAMVAEALYKKYFCPMEDITWCDAVGDNLKYELLEYVIASGNFGCKREYTHRAVLSVIKCFHNPVRFNEFLRRGGISHWKAARRHPVLRKFVVFYQIGHLIRAGIRSKVGVSVVKEEGRNSRAIMELMYKLEVTRI